jgi:uncharacterized protein with PQ loop repeat
MFKWFKNRNYWKEITEKIALKEQQYPIGTKFEVIDELPYDIVLLPGAVGTVKECGTDTISLRFYIGDFFARDIWMAYELLEEHLKILKA